ncbi:hypothetical protein D3C71_1424500 [compost metagenome]
MRGAQRVQRQVDVGAGIGGDDAGPIRPLTQAQPVADEARQAHGGQRRRQRHRAAHDLLRQFHVQRLQQAKGLRAGRADDDGGAHAAVFGLHAAHAAARDVQGADAAIFQHHGAGADGRAGKSQGRQGGFGLAIRFSDDAAFGTPGHHRKPRRDLVGAQHARVTDPAAGLGQPSLIGPALGLVSAQEQAAAAHPTCLVAQLGPQAGPKR